MEVRLRKTENRAKASNQNQTRQYYDNQQRKDAKFLIITSDTFDMRAYSVSYMRKLFSMYR